MNGKLQGLKVAILAANGFEQSELFEPKKALEEAGAQTFVISPEKGRIKGWRHTDWGQSVAVDIPLNQAEADDYNALVLPGGVMNPDKLRGNETAVAFVKAFFEPVGAICHGPWTLIDAGVAEGREMTSYHTIRKDLENAGAKWTDSEVVVDNGLITSRKPDDIPAFNEKLIEEFAESAHKKQEAAARA
jgi:protease I